MARTGDQLARRERLGDVVVGAELQPEDAIELAVAGGEQQHRDTRGVCPAGAHPEAAADVEAVDGARQSDVEHDEVGGPGGDEGEAVLAGRAAEDPERRLGQIQLEQVGDVVVVLDDDDRLVAHRAACSHDPVRAL